MKNPPKGYTAVTPHLSIDGCGKAIDFYKQALGAEELSRSPGPDGRLWHAEIQIGDARVMMSDVFPEMGGKPSVTTLHVFCDDADALYKRALDAGASGKMPPNDAFWGQRYSQILDPFGMTWAIATHIKDMTPDEMRKAGEEAMAQMGPKDKPPE